MTDNDQEMLGTLAEQYLDYLSGARPEPPSLKGLTPAQQREAHASWKLLDAARQAAEDYTPPPLETDPLAVALGLVPEPGRRLSGSRLKGARTKRRLQASQLADLLAARGWDVCTKTVFRWEQAARRSRPRCSQPSRKSCGFPRKNSRLPQVITTPPQRRSKPQRPRRNSPDSRDNGPRHQGNHSRMPVQVFSGSCWSQPRAADAT